MKCQQIFRKSDKEIFTSLKKRNMQDYYGVDKTLPPEPYQNQFNPDHTFIKYLLRTFQK